MIKRHKTVIFISNPFGFGPAGKAVALIEELRKFWKGRIVYAASSMCREILPKDLKTMILVEEINERDEGSLYSLFSKYEDPLVVCILNRLAIKTAKSLGLKAYFVDSLAWLWKEVPKEYLLADTYYCFNLFNVKDKLPDKSNIKVIPPVFGDLPVCKAERQGFLLFHIGGFKNPFRDGISDAYLNLLIDSFLKFKGNKKVVVTGGREAVTYLEDGVSNESFQFCTLGRDRFLEYLSQTSHFITTPGLTATLEAFALKTPVSFIPPTNLSQWKILRLLIEGQHVNLKIEWSDIFNYRVDFNELSEREAIPKFHQIAREVYNNKNYRSVFAHRLKNMLDFIPSTSEQTRLIDSVRVNGSRVIVQDLLLHLI